MAKTKKRGGPTKGAARVAARERSGVYRGKLTKTGNSMGFRFESPLFRSHPEFSGNVEAHVIAPGRLLVVAEPDASNRSAAEDPVLGSFLAFLAADMQQYPEGIRPLDARENARIEKLVAGAKTSIDEELGPDEILE